MSTSHAQRVTKATAARPPLARGPVSRHQNIPQGRLVVTVAVIALVALALGFRLAFYQIADHAALSAKAANLTLAAPAQPMRGVVYDDAGNVLALSDVTYEIQADPQEITTPWQTAGRLARVLKQPRLRILRLLRSNSSNVILATKVPQTTATAVGNLNILGVALGPNPNRVYPEGSLAAHVLGFASPLKAGVLTGQYGVEQAYDPLLNGSATAGAFIRWARAQRFRTQTTAGPNASQVLDVGATLRLSIDTYMQDVVEQALKHQVKKVGASSGTAIVMEPKTGRIVALANYPWFNPNAPGRSKLWKLSDPAIDSTYEPGSTFKIITMAGGLNAHVITPATAIYDPGWMVYPQCSPSAIHNWNYPVSNGRETMTQVLQHSANVGASYVANLLGTHRFYHYVRRFGVGTPTGVDLAGEATGIVPLPGVAHSNWTCVNLYDNGFGQALTVTPLQLLTAVNAVANHGAMVRPSVVNSISYRGITAYRVPFKVRRVINPHTAHELSSMLVQSATGPPGEYGEAACALVPGYKVAAKTGTANLVDPRTGLYKKGPGSTIASTVGFAPAFHPRFSVLVIIRKPRYNWAVSQWGSETAAPIVHDIFASLFLHYHIAPTASNSARVLSSQKLFGGCSF